MNNIHPTRLSETVKIAVTNKNKSVNVANESYDYSPRHNND